VRNGSACCGSPGREEHGRKLTRVSLLGSGLVAAAGALAGSVTQASAAESVQVWGLDPNWSGGGVACGCSECRSCVAHAANKLFANAAAADSGRAHLHCKCLVVPLMRLDEDRYTSLFLNGGGRESVDRRYQWVQAVFKDDPPPELSSFAPPVESSVRAGSVRTAPAVHAVLGRVWIRHRASGQRALYADVAAEQAVTVTLSIARQGPTIARKVVTGVNGSRRLKLAIPASTKAGPARLRLRFRDAAGTSRVVTRSIQIPHV
jgi:hypothetical protein